MIKSIVLALAVLGAISGATLAIAGLSAQPVPACQPHTS